MPRLRRINSSGPGINRRRVGRGFTYWTGGQRVTDPDVLARIGQLSTHRAVEQTVLELLEEGPAAEVRVA